MPAPMQYPARLTRLGNYGKLNVYSARFFTLRVSLVRMQQARRENASRRSELLRASEKIGRRKNR
jgi:hypothetical protein